MRLIRSILRPAKFNTSLQLQRCQEGTSTAHLRPVLIETSNLVHKSNVQFRGRSYAASAPSASAPSDTLVSRRKERKRVPKEERKSMVENYVNKYREMNAGKFPTTSDAKRVAGGSYYVVRQILQELKYNSVTSPTDARGTEKSVMKEDKISKSSESKKKPRSSTSVEVSFRDETQNILPVSESKDVETQPHKQSDKPKSSLHCDPEKNIKWETTHENKLKFDELQHNAEPQVSTETEVSGRELQREPSGDVEPQGKSSMWQNLKSFANVILGIWKR